jgi:ABC-type Fe3+/spermidine/putrescine transport system ATPase subunit
MPGVVVHEVSKRFGAVRAVDGVSLVVADGRLLTLLGPSGCGKTTTLEWWPGWSTTTPDASASATAS